MQQLTLFGKNTGRSSQVQRKTRVRKTWNNGRTVLRWDLWTQETESEKEMALFFLDIRNFTPLVEKHQALDVIHIVKKLFSRFQNIIRNYHGRIIETSGDGFYAAFGFEQNIQDAVNASVEAGSAILQSLDRLNEHLFEKKLHQRIDIGIGIHVGKVATGNIRLGSKDHFVVMGYPVNVAARLQSATKDLNNDFIVSSTAVNMLKNSPPLSHPVTVNLKGLTTPCEVYLMGKAYAA